MLIIFRFTHCIMRLIAAPFSFDHATVMGCLRGRRKTRKTSKYVRLHVEKMPACQSEITQMQAVSTLK